MGFARRLAADASLGDREKLMVLPEDVEVFPGHGPSTTIGDEKKDQSLFINGQGTKLHGAV